MAKRHKRKTTHRRRSRSRVSGIGSSALMHAVAIVGGAVGAKMLSKALEGKVNNKILAAGMVGVGVFIPKFIHGPAGEGIAAGFIAAGGTQALQEFGVLKGIGAIGEDDTLQMEYLSGIGDGEVPALVGSFDDEGISGGLGDIPVLAGVGTTDDEVYD